MDRRSFLRLIGIGAIGTAVASKGGTWLRNEFQPEEASAAIRNKTFSIGDFQFNGKHIEIFEHDGIPMLQIDGKHVSHHTIAKTVDGYGSHLLPFSEFTDPTSLVKQLLEGDERLFIL